MVRICNVGIDTGLLLAGVSLWAMGCHNPMREPWLLAKLLLLLTYIVAGTYALKSAADTPQRMVALWVAWLIAAQMVSMALTKNWLGLFSVWLNV